MLMYAPPAPEYSITLTAECGVTVTLSHTSSSPSWWLSQIEKWHPKPFQEWLVGVENWHSDNTYRIQMVNRKDKREKAVWTLHCAPSPVELINILINTFNLKLRVTKVKITPC